MVHRISVEAAFAWAQRFAQREWRLLLPVALAFFALPGLLFDVALPHALQTLMPGARSTPANQGGALAALTVTMIVNLYGGLTVVALALVPGISVREALARAATRLPILIGAWLLAFAALLAVAVALALVLGTLRIDAVTMTKLLFAAILVASIALWVRLLPLPPLLIERGGTPVSALRRAWRLTAGAGWRLLGAVAVFSIGSGVVLIAIASAGGALLLLAARATGVPGLDELLPRILFHALAAIVSTALQLLVVGLYRQLTGARSGT